jgi:hypothetical protein
MTHPIYLPSLGRAENCLTPDTLIDGGVKDFKLVVEADEEELYAKRFGKRRVIVVPHHREGIAVTRSWIKMHSEDRGEAWHWQIDDDIDRFATREPGKSAVTVPAREAIEYAEEFTERYSNLAGICISSIQYPTTALLHVNQQIYTVMAIRNGTPYYWRSGCVEDTDFSIQLLAGGWCTIAIKIYRASAPSTMSLSGGNTEAEYEGDKRLHRIRGLQRNWPHLIKLTRRSGIPKAQMAGLWRKFRTRLELAS